MTIYLLVILACTTILYADDTSSAGRYESWNGLEVFPMSIDTLFCDNFNRPDTTGDAWGTPVIGGAYTYINAGNADFAISSHTGYLDDNENTGDPRAVSEFSVCGDSYTLEFSCKFEGGRGSGVLLYNGTNHVSGLIQEGYTDHLQYFNGTEWVNVENRELDVWKDYRIEVTGTTAKIYVDDTLVLTTFTEDSPIDRIQFWAQGNPDGIGTSDTWYDDVVLSEGVEEPPPDAVYYDNFNRPDATGDAWGTPVIGGAYTYINAGNADFAISSHTGYLDDNTNTGDPQAISEFSVCGDSYTLEYSWKYEGGNGSGIILCNGTDHISGLMQDGNTEYLLYYNGTAWVNVENRELDVWKDYRIEVTGIAAKIYVDDILVLTTSTEDSSIDRIKFWAQGTSAGMGASDSWYDDVSIVLPTSAEAECFIEVSATEIGSIYPNPSSASLSISYTISSSTDLVNLAIYDISGRVVQTVISGMETAGNHSVIVSGLTSGVYFCRLSAAGTTDSSRFVVID